MSKRRHSQLSGLRDRAERMASKLRDNYQLGQEANGESEENGVSTQQFAADRGLSEHTVRKLRAYNARELRELCALRRPNGLPLHWGYVDLQAAARQVISEIQVWRKRLELLVRKFADSNAKLPPADRKLLDFELIEASRLVIRRRGRSR